MSWPSCPTCTCFTCKEQTVPPARSTGNRQYSDRQLIPPANDDAFDVLRSVWRAEGDWLDVTERSPGPDLKLAADYPARHVGGSFDNHAKSGQTAAKRNGSVRVNPGKGATWRFE